MTSKRKDGPYWVKAWIADLSMLTDSFRDLSTGAVNFEALGKEEYLFRMALSRKDFSLSNRAKKVWEEAVGPYRQRITAANKKKSPQDAPHGNAGEDGKSATSCDQLTADGDTREGSQAIPDGSAISRNETRATDALDSSANIYGDAPHREAGNGEDARTTVSKPFALECPPDKCGQPAKTGDNGESRRYAPPSCSPEDGNLYDQGATQDDYHTPVSISTDDPMPEGLTGPSHGGSVAQNSEHGSSGKTRAGGNSLRMVAKVSIPPARLPGPMPEDKLSNVKTLDLFPATDAKKPYGTCGLVMLTDAEGRHLREIYGDRLAIAIDILDAYIENNGKAAKKYTNHAAVLRRGNWVWNRMQEIRLTEKRLENADKRPMNWKAEERERTARVLRGESADGKNFLRDEDLTPEQLEAKYA